MSVTPTVLAGMREQLRAQERREEGLPERLRAAEAAAAAAADERDARAEQVAALEARLAEVNAQMQTLRERLGAASQGAGGGGGGAGERESEVGRLAMVAVPHACLCIQRSLEQLSERQASPSLLASLSLALLALQDVAAPATRLIGSASSATPPASACLARLAHLASSAGAGAGGARGRGLVAEEREALYALALGSTLSGGRKELAGVAGVAVTLARVSAVAACLDEMRWATLALGCALMVSERVRACVRACVRECV